MTQNSRQRELVRIKWFEEQELAHYVAGDEQLSGEGDDADDDANEAPGRDSSFGCAENECSAGVGFDTHDVRYRVSCAGSEGENVENEANNDDARRRGSRNETGVEGDDDLHDSHGGIPSAASDDEDKENEPPSDTYFDAVEAHNDDISPDDSMAVDSLVNTLAECQVVNDDSDKTMSISTEGFHDDDDDKENDPSLTLLPGEPSARFISNLASIAHTCLRSPNWAPVMSQLKTLISSRRINKLVVLALGSLYRHHSCYGNWIVELGFVFALREMLAKEAGGATPRLIFQDPDFTPHDVTLLTSLGGTVLTHPAALRATDAHTFVHARCPPWDFLYRGVLHTRPAVLVTVPLTPGIEASKSMRESEVLRGFVLHSMAEFMRGRKCERLERVVLELWEGVGASDWLECLRVYSLDAEAEAEAVPSWLKTL